MDKIITMQRQEFDEKLKYLISRDSGSDGVIYFIKNGYVLKHLRDKNIMSDFGEKIHDANKLIQFSDIENNSYFFAKSIIMIDKLVEAEIMKRCKGYNVININPLSVNLLILKETINIFTEDTKAISNLNIKGYDMSTNFMYDGHKFGAIDTLYYDRSDEDTNEIYKYNISFFNKEMVLFLTEQYFSYFVKRNKDLKSISKSIILGKEFNLIEFIDLLIKKLSEYCDREIIYLEDAKKAIKEVPDSKDYPINYANVYLKK